MRLFKRLLSLCACCLPFFADAQMFERVDDLALIWIGGPHRPDWNKDLFWPYVVHDYADGHCSWLFDGFLMIEGSTFTPDLKIAYSFGESHDMLANQEQWKTLLENQLGTYTGFGCKALDSVIDDLIPTLGEPAYKHQVVLTLPIARTPAPGWGKINGVAMNFDFLEDRITGMKWYIDYVIERWNASGFKHLELAGVYWLRESVDDFEVPLAKAITPYVRQKGLASYWIPYFNGNHYADWKELGFDQVYYQPNYVFTDNVPLDRLDTAIGQAYDAEIGMEMEFEGFYVDGNDHSVYPQSNTCLYHYSTKFYQRFVDYVDKFEEYSVFDFMPLAYYNGYQGIYDFATSSHPKDQEILDRLASLIEMRHRVSGWYIPETSSIDELALEEQRYYARAGKGELTVLVTGPAKITSIDGRVVWSGVSTATTTVPCSSGIYIVSCARGVAKICVD